MDCFEDIRLSLRILSGKDVYSLVEMDFLGTVVPEVL